MADAVGQAGFDARAQGRPDRHRQIGETLPPAPDVRRAGPAALPPSAATELRAYRAVLDAPSLNSPFPTR
ncbi:hypothetical protein ACWCQZ_14630 [Streptomyces sp. NPDC002285]|uniref:hypothetical protein n=1 Tax=unclassified Streptomyces TaxID=2593676 RepID=UPI003684D531